ncbi:acyl-[acyl-carrier-protein] thioesterase [Ornithinibacillus halotolerans]|uniref:Acyl-ACP thioesterase n=1 Tax=Ornithinibacillus halotolerans TaxID=1274357 RepID=A0A916RTD6_9BACI|nr:acyl-ACP thioesterase domain-containing protein [Ornithinibacillus halotolerans]GGA66572.1 acyl-ACP thioesterase [Ornithinibacillus halotolerans]
MQPTTKYEKTYPIELSDVDFKKELKLSALFNYFQDIANLAAENLGVGINDLLEKYGVAFVLMRIRVDVIRTPQLGEELQIETWPLQPGKLEFERDFIVRDSSGNIIARAVSVWVIMDLKKRRLKRSDAINLTYPELIEEKAIDVELKKLKAAENIEIAYYKKIGYSDIDFNGHLNNSRYVDYIMDCFQLEEIKQYNTKSIEVNYLNEALPGDTLVLKKSIDSNLVFVEGYREADHKVVFRAKVNIERKIKRNRSGN